MPDLPTPPAAELLSQMRTLPRADKVFLFHQLEQDLQNESPDTLIPDNRTIEIWSPYDAHEAEAALLQLLEESKTPR